MVHRPQELKNNIVSYFEKVYSKQSALGLEELDCNFKVLKVDSATALEQPFTQDEVHGVIKNCNGNKTSGPNGYNMCFIQEQWEMLKNPIMEFMTTFFETTSFPRVLNASFLTLIPKCEGPTNLHQYRPISLMGCIYKILAKVLANRIRKVLGEVIGENQFAFMGGRQILDCSLIANEAIDWLRKGRGGGICFKVDFEKAYDTVDWNFLQFAMKKMGFGERWIRWIKSCISTADLPILVNGSPTRQFRMSRGLRQGSPLSPFLFNIVAEVLSILLHKAISLGLFEGLQLGNRMLSHLQYADDTIVFCQAGKEQLLNVKRVLRYF